MSGPVQEGVGAVERVERVRGGTIWTENGPVVGDLVIDQEGRIAALVPDAGRGGGADGGGDAPGSGGGRIIDASGLWVLPGAVDVHVHFREPGLTESEDFLSGSAAAACGGVTTVLDMPNTLPPVSDGAALAAKLEAVRGRSYVDYGLFGAAVAGGEETLAARVEELASLGACGIKVFLGPTTGDIAAPGWGALYELCRRWAGSGLVFAFHCEDRDVIRRAAAEEAHLDPEDYRSLLFLRPRFGELLATDGALRLARETGARVHIAHVALKEAVEAIARAKEDGAPVTAETCPHYLLLDEGDYAAVGRAMKALPPVRAREDREALWRGLREGIIDAVATDHAPHRVPGRRGEPVWSPPFGVAGVQSLVPLLVDAAARGLCRVEQVVRWTSANPARAYGLYPRKGRLEPGADADLVVIDPRARWRIERPWWKSKSANTPFWGREGLGAPVCTLVRGWVVAERGEVVGPPRGELLRPRERKAPPV